MKKIFSASRFWQFMTVILLIVFAISNSSSGVINFNNFSNISTFSVIEPAQAIEIYPMFTCPCGCGETLDTEKPCGAMLGMIDFVDRQISLDKSKDEVVLATAKEFGIDRLTNEEDRAALRQKLADLAPSDAPKIEISETSRDLGTVSQKQGIVTTDFEFKNAGKSNLVIDKLSSSCNCTSASIVYDGEVGPEFAMEGHGKENPKDWEVAIKPGDTAVLRIYYDPSVHPDLEGAVTRTVSIMSNDPAEFEIKVAINLEQTK